MSEGEQKVGISEKFDDFWGDDPVPEYNIEADSVEASRKQEVSPLREIERKRLEDGVEEMRGLLEEIPRERDHGGIRKPLLDPNILEFRAPAAIVFEYSAGTSLALNCPHYHPQKDEEHGRGILIDLIATVARENLLDVPIYSPSDFQGSMNIADNELADTLEESVRILDVPEWKNDDMHATFLDAVQRLSDDAVLVTYDEKYAQGNEEGINDEVPAGTAYHIIQGLELNLGEWDYPVVNRLDNMRDYINWKPGTEPNRGGTLPEQYQDIDPEAYTDFSVLVLDHSTRFDHLFDAAFEDPSTGETYAGDELLRLYQDILEYREDGADIPVVQLGDQFEKLDTVMPTAQAEAFVDDTSEIADTLEINRSIDAGEYEHAEEDYQITESARREYGETPLIVTPDKHFSEFSHGYGLPVGKVRDVLAERYGA